MKITKKSYHEEINHLFFETINQLRCTDCADPVNDAWEVIMKHIICDEREVSEATKRAELDWLNEMYIMARVATSIAQDKLVPQD